MGREEEMVRESVDSRGKEGRREEDCKKCRDRRREGEKDTEAL